MSYLAVYHQSSLDQPDKVLTHHEDIAATLAEHGVSFTRWAAEAALAPGAVREQVIDAYRADLDRWMSEGLLPILEVISLDGQADAAALEVRTLGVEHRHAADQAFLFAGGRATVYLHLGDRVFAVLCERHDRLEVPAGTAQWLDAGETARVIVIRLFGSEEGSRAIASGNDIASCVAPLEG